MSLFSSIRRRRLWEQWRAANRPNGARELNAIRRVHREWMRNHGMAVENAKKGAQ